MEKTADDARRVRAVAAASIGNALEWFDFIIYGFFAITMAKLFFPTGNETVSLLLALATFGVPFFIRPLGAIVIDNYADRHGRKAAFSMTIVLMMLGTAIIAAAPTYATAGVFAPMLIVLARLVQGFSAGGEFGSSTAFLAEQNPDRRGFYASWQFASQGFTTVLATIIGVGLTTSLTASQLESWGWRIPFLIGLLIGPVAWYIRRNVDETVEFKRMQVSKSPVKETFSEGRKRLLVSLGVVALCTVSMYTIVLFMPTYATRQFGLTTSVGFLGAMLVGAIQVVLIPVFGALSDRDGRLTLMLASAAAMVVLFYPMFAWLAASPTLQTLLVIQAIFGVLTAAYMGPLGALMSELFPPQTRTTGLAVSYAFGVAIFGGLAPFTSTWLILISGNKLAPAFYLMMAGVVSLIALVFARRLGCR